MLHNLRQMATDGMRTEVLALDRDDAIELARQALTGRGITPGKDWYVSDDGNCWVVQNEPVVRLLVSKDTGQVLSHDSPGN
jgi:hypothetical protein